MEIPNAEIIKSLLTLDGVGWKEKKDRLKKLLARIDSECSCGNTRFYISMLMSEVESFTPNYLKK